MSIAPPKLNPPVSGPKAASPRGARPAVALVLGVLAVLAALAGCAGGAVQTEAVDAANRIDPPAFTQQSLVYGYLDMSDAPTDLGWMDFEQLEPPTDTPYYHMRIHDGVFYMEKFRPGVFVLSGFGGTRWNGKQLAYSLPRSSPAVRVEIHQPGLAYVGAYRYRAVESNGHRTGRFEIDRIDDPDEAGVLRRILPFAAGTPWEARIRERMTGAP